MMKLKTLITEAELNPASVKGLAMLTDINNHTRAILELARYVGDKRLIKAYEGLMYIQDLLRDSNDIKNARARLDKQLFAKAKKKYKNFNDIYKAF